MPSPPASAIRLPVSVAAVPPVSQDSAAERLGDRVVGHGDVHRVFDPNALLARPNHVVGDRGVRHTRQANDARLAQRIAVADDPKPVQRCAVAQCHAAQNLRSGGQVRRRAGQRQWHPAGIGLDVMDLCVGQQRDAFRNDEHRRRLVVASVRRINKVPVLGHVHRLVQRAEGPLERTVAARRTFDDVQDLPRVALQAARYSP